MLATPAARSSRLWSQRNLGRRTCNPTNPTLHRHDRLPMPNVEIKILEIRAKAALARLADRDQGPQVMARLTGSSR